MRSRIETLPSVSLEQVLAEAALQTRVDRKYLVPADRLDRLLDAAPARIAVLAIDGRRRFGYRSVYFDTAELAAFHLAGRSRRRRFKVRTRVYLDSGETWLEVKTTGQRGATVKDRLVYDLADAGRLNAEAIEFIGTIFAEHRVSEVDPAELVPVLHTGYQRATLLLADDRGASRATVDSGLTWRRPGATGGLTVPGFVVVETKGGAAPGPLDQALWRHGMRPRRISKYGAGLAALDSSLPELKWHRLLGQLSLTVT